jgi:hypothetical protein
MLARRVRLCRRSRFKALRSSHSHCYCTGFWVWVGRGMDADITEVMAGLIEWSLVFMDKEVVMAGLAHPGCSVCLRGIGLGLYPYLDTNRKRHLHVFLAISPRSAQRMITPRNCSPTCVFFSGLLLATVVCWKPNCRGKQMTDDLFAEKQSKSHTNWKLFKQTSGSWLQLLESQWIIFLQSPI